VAAHRLVVPPAAMLHSDRCLLRRPRPADAAGLLSATSDPRWPELDFWAVVDTEEEARSRLADQIEQWDDQEAFHFSVEIESSSEFVGQVSLTPEPEPQTWLLGYWLTPDRWGVGLATEAAALVARFAFASLDARSIWAGTAIWNVASQRVVEKLGFIYMNDNPAGYTLRGTAIATREYELRASPPIGLTGACS
jgi:RimJ/RimL family protein N-acetyltransferase